MPAAPNSPVAPAIFSATIIVNKDNAGYGMKVKKFIYKIHNVYWILIYEFVLHRSQAISQFMYKV